MAKSKRRVQRKTRSKHRGSRRVRKTVRNRRLRMRGGRLDAQQKAILARDIAPVLAFMAQDNAFDADVKRFFRNEETYFEALQSNGVNAVQRMDPWILRNQLSNPKLVALHTLLRTVRLLGDTETNLNDVIDGLNAQGLIDNEDLDTVKEFVRDHYHMLNNNNSVVVNPNEV